MVSLYEYVHLPAVTLSAASQTAGTASPRFLGDSSASHSAWTLHGWDAAQKVPSLPAAGPAPPGMQWWAGTSLQRTATGGY